MRKLKDFRNHQCAPGEFRRVSDMTGSYELDGAIQMTRNKDMADRLRDHLTGDAAYERKTPYQNKYGIG